MNQAISIWWIFCQTINCFMMNGGIDIYFLRRSRLKSKIILCRPTLINSLIKRLTHILRAIAWSMDRFVFRSVTKSQCLNCKSTEKVFTCMKFCKIYFASDFTSFSLAFRYFSASIQKSRFSFECSFLRNSLFRVQKKMTGFQKWTFPDFRRPSCPGT